MASFWGLCSSLSTSCINKMEKGMQHLGCFWVEPRTPAWSLSAQALCEHTGLTCIRAHLPGDRTHTRATGPYQTWPSGPLLKQLGSRPHPWQVCDSHTSKRSDTTSRQGYCHHNTSHTPYQKGDSQHTLWMYACHDLQTVLAPRILDSHSLHRDGRT